MIEVCLMFCPQWAQNESDGEQNMNNTERGFRCRMPSSSTQRRALAEILCLKVITGSRSNRLLFQNHFPVLRSGRRTGGLMRLVVHQVHVLIERQREGMMWQQWRCCAAKMVHPVSFLHR
jgi:hypothetical protein